MVRSFLLVCLAVLLLIAASAGCASTSTPASSQSENAAIVSATTQFARSHSLPAQFDVSVEIVQGDYARARVSTPDASICPAAVFLRKQKGTWSVLTMGSVIEPGFYERYRVPDSLRLP